MSEKEKLSLIDYMIGEAWEWSRTVNSESGFFEGVLCAVNSVVGFTRDEEGL